jgi:hypothetical protein
MLRFPIDFSGVTMTMGTKLGEIVEPFDQKDGLELGERLPGNLTVYYWTKC